MSRSGRIGRERVMTNIWAAPRPHATNGQGTIPGFARWTRANPREAVMSDDKREKLDDTIAGTGLGIPDDALGPGEQLPEAPTDEQVEEAAEALDAPIAKRERDTLPLEGE